MNVLIGVDPGRRTGIAIYRAGLLHDLRTMTPEEARTLIAQVPPDLVVLEDSRRQSAVFNRPVSRRAMLKIARNVGEIDQLCREIALTCASREIPYIGVSPLGKGAKLNAARFKEITGWAGRSNQHERDAAMCAHPYRRAVEIRGRK